ncbi:MAG: DEAD/DEAH box helicase family protein, partial [Methanobrevibacter sp.]|nr:DEAD/DEAH box helicase family protein [Methanobrevibacter sp.]
MIHWSLTGHHPRNTQIQLINKINHAIGEGYKNIILEAGTGIGKSAIATTLAKMYEDSYILTMTKQLQEQYLHDFGDMLVEIKGKGNYKCNYKGNCDF